MEIIKLYVPESYVNHFNADILTVDSIYSFIDGGTHISNAFDTKNLIFCMSLIETLLGCLTG